MRSIINHDMIVTTTQVDDTDGNFNSNTTEYEIYRFLFLSGFSFRNIQESQDCRERIYV